MKRYCLVCGAEITHPHNKKYCSEKCFHAAHKVYMREHPSNPRKRVTIYCRECGKAVETTASLKNRKHFCSRECENAGKRKLFGPDHPLYTKVTKHCEWCKCEYTCKAVHTIRSRFCSRECLGFWTAANFPKGETSIEAAVRHILESLHEPYVAQKQMSRYLCDFVLKRRKLVIECDGDYWHSSERQKAKDARKDHWLTHHTYHVLRLKGSLIDSDISACRALIVKAMGDRYAKVSAYQLALF